METVQAVYDFNRNQGYNQPWKGQGQGQGNWGGNQRSFMQSENYNQGGIYNQGSNFNQGGQKPFMQGGSSSYNPNSTWKPNPPPGFIEPKQEAKKPSLEDLLLKTIERVEEMHKDHGKRMDQFEARMNQNENKFTQIDATMRSFDMKLGQLAQSLQSRPQGSLPSDTIPNPKGNGKEQCHAIMLRSGLEIGPKELVENESEKVVEEEIPTEQPKSNEEVDEPAGGAKQGAEKSTLPRKGAPGPFNYPDFVPPPPFPERPKKVAKPDPHFNNFEEMMRKIQVSVPLAHLIMNVPKYKKYLKDLFFNKTKFEHEGVISLNENCSLLIKNDFPPKMKDPGSTTIPCVIGNRYFDKSLCDLGASINLMPLSIATEIGLSPQIKPVNMTLQLADRSVVKPDGIVEDVLIKVDKFVVVADFVILDMVADREIPIIFGRPFLSTVDAMVGVRDKSITFKINGESITFKMDHAMKHPNEVRKCHTIDVNEECERHSNFVIDCGKRTNDEANEEKTSRGCNEDVKIATELANGVACCTLGILHDEPALGKLDGKLILKKETMENEAGLPKEKKKSKKVKAKKRKIAMRWRPILFPILKCFEWKSDDHGEISLPPHI